MKKHKPLPPAGGNGTPPELEKVNLTVGDGGHKKGTTSHKGQVTLYASLPPKEEYSIDCLQIGQGSIGSFP